MDEELNHALLLLAFISTPGIGAFFWGDPDFHAYAANPATKAVRRRAFEMEYEWLIEQHEERKRS